jgi:hypothetical protein
MSGLRLSIAASAGALGAVLVALLVLGRSDAPVVLTLADLDRGGVIVARAEVYQRHGGKLEQLARLREDGDIGLYPEHRVQETWILLDTDGEIVDMVGATWIEDGSLLQRVSFSGNIMVTERPDIGVRDERALGGRSIGELPARPSEFIDAAAADFEAQQASGGWVEVQAPAGWVRLERRRRIDRSELMAVASAGFSVPYFGDLDAVEMVTQLSQRVGGPEGMEERFVVLRDGSTVLVESRLSSIEARASSEWEAFLVRVGGD